MQPQPNLLTGFHRALRSAPAQATLCIVVVAVVPAGCTSFIADPDQSEFAPLEELAAMDEPVARLYIAPTAGVGLVATHGWFVVKEADAHTFDRWEVSSHTGGPYGYVRQNIREPEEYLDSIQVSVWAELIGDQACDVVDFINGQSPLYPCRYLYLYYPGPNCNTYVQWVIDETGWDVRLPPTALGKDTPVLCW